VRLSAYHQSGYPPFDNSGMDGYAVRSEDIQNASPNHPVQLEVIEDLPAGLFQKAG
jgi:molybdopterin molybdotransferase